MSKQFHFVLVVFLFLTLCIPELGLASVEGTLETIQSKLVNVILPLVAILGLVFSAFSFITGNPNAKAHLFLAVIGCAVGFGAQSIVNFVRDLVN